MNKSLYFIILILIALKLFLIILNPFFLQSKEIEEKIVWGKWSEPKINQLLKSAEKTNSFKNRMLLISDAFINTEYSENTLIGNTNTPEILTINFELMDCFTYIDYVEALSNSENFEEFKKNLIDTRYKENLVSYENRKHFFSDWLANPNIQDVTKKIAENEAKIVRKNLNKKSKTEIFLEGIPIIEREIIYIPSEKVDSQIIANLKNGDYIGIYTDRAGLDVSHTGILIKKDNKSYLRHASSRKKNRKVVDEDFLNYIKSKPGIVVYRKKNL